TADNEAIIILGSSRKDGNTQKIVDIFNREFRFEVVHLIEKNIGYYDYTHSNRDDDFSGIIDKIADKKLVIFATPVYWYSMSAPLKTFFDRFSDLLRLRKDVREKLIGKEMMVISCGSSALDYDFYLPFRKTAEYLKMNYIGDIHGWAFADTVPEEVATNIEAFSKNLNALRTA
ncbi:MAG: NAD(P)H-dependent oxidoreductase, partial [Sinomicrobium sp.]|nr:NAD(P)H-dependent oxidoreductase [Sinomicrobium sp.]